MITSHEKQELRDTICWSSKPSWTLITLLTGIYILFAYTLIHTSLREYMCTIYR
ncbi:hypothetical protein Hanom_Chr10g00947351 [Helianthus anomalus]